MSQDWNFAPSGTAVLPPPGPKPTPKRFRKVLRREEAHLESLRPDATQGEAATAPETPAEQAGRDASGRFTKGNKGGTGNPFARQTAEFRKAITNALTAADFDELTRMLLAKAKGGDLAALKLLFSYGVGRLAEPPDPDRLELDDFQILRKRLSPLQHDWLLIRKMVPVEGIIEAGHRVADARAEAWREEVLGDAVERLQQAAAAAAAFRAAEDATLAEALADIRGAVSRGPEWQATMKNLVREFYAKGCLKEALAELAAQRGKTLKDYCGMSPPSANGGTAPAAPSPNGLTDASAPSTNGHAVVRDEAARQSAPQEEVKAGATRVVVLSAADHQELPNRLSKQPVIQLPSTNGPAEVRPPSANGGNGRVAPSINGSNGRAAPSANGGNGG